MIKRMFTCFITRTRGTFESCLLVISLLLRIWKFGIEYLKEKKCMTNVTPCINTDGLG